MTVNELQLPVSKMKLNKAFLASFYLYSWTKTEVYMKNPFSRTVSRALAVAGLCSLAALTACGDSSSSPSKSKAQECAEGLSAECLVGSWNLIGISYVGETKVSPLYNYQAAPGVLTFNEDGSFQFSMPQGAPAALTTDEDCNPYINGTWNVEGKILNFVSDPHKNNNMQMCLNGKKSFAVSPTIALEENQIKMTFGQLVLMEHVTDDDSKNYLSEVYTISAK